LSRYQSCHVPQETTGHLLLDCRRWRLQRGALYKALEKAGVSPPQQGEEAPEGRIFRDQKVTKTLLIFITATGIGGFPVEAAREADRLLRDNLMGLGLVEEVERRGEG
jgi:hypothetical protein